MPLKAVLFDVGNTLIYEHKDWREIERKGVEQLIITMKGHGMELDEPSFIESILKIREENFRKALETDTEITALECLSQVLQQTSVANISNELLNRGVEAFFHPQEKISTLLPGVPETLRKLSYNGYSLGIVSNATSSLSVRRVLENQGILHWFRTVVISADVKYRKPKPEIFHIALSGMGVEPEEAVYIGNTVKFDVQGARAAGLKTILFRIEQSDEEIETHVEPDYAISKIQQIMDIVKKIK